jgi:DNA-3-methyladenine glycosylase
MTNFNDILMQKACEVAPRLLGSTLVRSINKQEVKVKIVEVEAYDQSDAASHSFKGKTERTKIMFNEPGFLYVYFTYGMHYCCNVVVEGPGHGAAVLIRAVEPIKNEELMATNRIGVHGVNLSNGPAKLCQALKIDKTLNGHDLRHDPLKLIIEPEIKDKYIVQTTRIGISKEVDKPWRFYIKDNAYVSKP